MQKGSFMENGEQGAHTNPTPTNLSQEPQRSAGVCKLVLHRVAMQCVLWGRNLPHHHALPEKHPAPCTHTENRIKGWRRMQGNASKQTLNKPRVRSLGGQKGQTCHQGGVQGAVGRCWACAFPQETALDFSARSWDGVGTVPLPDFWGLAGS